MPLGAGGNALQGGALCSSEGQVLVPLSLNCRLKRYDTTTRMKTVRGKPLTPSALVGPCPANKGVFISCAVRMTRSRAAGLSGEPARVDAAG